MPKRKTQRKRVAREFDRDALKRICEMDERDFASAYDMETVEVEQRHPFDFYNFKDNGSRVLAVAHLDTVTSPEQRRCAFLDYAGGTVVYSRALDDRLGAYVILELLPRLGLTYDWLLATGEECGRSTAAFFDLPDGKEYDWIIEFDRAGTDVVMYEYEDTLTRELVRHAGAPVGWGSFSDICWLEHLGVKAFNWGVGYHDAHGNRAHAYLNDTFDMVTKYLKFHEDNEGWQLEHEESWSTWSRNSWTKDDFDDEAIKAKIVMPEPPKPKSEADKKLEEWLIECEGCNDLFGRSIMNSVVLQNGEKAQLCQACYVWAESEGFVASPSDLEVVSYGDQIR